MVGNNGNTYNAADDGGDDGDNKGKRERTKSEIKSLVLKSLCLVFMSISGR